VVGYVRSIADFGVFVGLPSFVSSSGAHISGTLSDVPLPTACWWLIIDNCCHYGLSWSSVERNVCHSVNGLCPRTLLADQFVSQPKEYFKLGQTVYARVTEIDAEKVNHIV